MSTDVQTCYRHGDRRAGVRCQRCDRPICPDCMQAASVGFHCPECRKEGAQRVYTARSLINRPLVTFTLIGLNVATFLLVNMAGAGGITSNDGSLFEPLVATGEWWRIVTSGFLHANTIHLAFNVWALYILGTMLEPVLGRLRFGIIYFAGLLGGSFGVMLISDIENTVGASGAVFGLMGAAVAAQRARGIDPWASGLGGLLLINLIFTFSIPNISIGGHLGGLVGGYVAGFVYDSVGPRLKTKLLADALAVGLVLAFALVGLAIAQVPTQF